MQTPQHPALLAPSFIDEVERRLARALTWRERVPATEVLGAAARHLCLSSDAKRARPYLVHLFGRAVGADPEGLAALAVAAECIHTASLLHDDVIDEGKERRNRPTANAVWGNLAAVLSGDLVLIQALQGIRDLPRPITDEALDVIAVMTRAALLEALGRGDASLSTDDWRRIARGKTGALLSWCGRSAALLAGAPAAADRFGRCGMHLGVAYQLADDLRDLTAGDGKTALADIRSGNPSFAVLYAASVAPDLRRHLQTAWACRPLCDAQVHELAQAVLDTGAAEATLAEIDREAEAAMDALGPWLDHPSGEDIARWARLLLYRNIGEPDAARPRRAEPA